MKIAIQGHPTRGKEIIQILESLGGRNRYNFNGFGTFKYYIDSFNKINIAAYLTSDWKIYSLEEFEKEFPFKVGDIVLLKGLNKPYEIIALEWYMDKLCYKLDSGLHFAPETLTTYEKMKEERNITLTLDKAKEWYKKGGELKEIALQAFTEKELTKTDLPKTWEEFCENYPVQSGECWLGSCDEIYKKTYDKERIYKNWIPSIKSAEAHLAMIQLEQLRDCWRQGWKPTRGESYYVIKIGFRGLDVYRFCTVEFLSFPTYEMAEEFLKCFRDLIEKAGDLI